MPDGKQRPRAASSDSSDGRDVERHADASPSSSKKAGDTPPEPSMTDSPNPYRPIGDHRERPSESGDAPADTAPSGQESNSTDLIWLLVLLIGLVSFGLSVHLWGAVTESW